MALQKRGDVDILGRSQKQLKSEWEDEDEDNTSQTKLDTPKSHADQDKPTAHGAACVYGMPLLFSTLHCHIRQRESRSS